MCVAVSYPVLAQPAIPGRINITVFSDKQTPLSPATVTLFRSKDSVLVYTRVTNAEGIATFENIPDGGYFCRISMVDHITQYTALIQVSFKETASPVPAVVMKHSNKQLATVTVSGKQALVRHTADKTIVNVEASITSAGATVMEVLEKSPGVSVDRNGNISLKGRPNVLVLIDGKPTYISGTELSNMLSSMSASQIEQIEIMDNPPAKYDAVGNAGIINIKTKKNKQQGFNGSVTANYSQGVYPKSNNSLNLNYRTGKVNFFVNYSLNTMRQFTDLYALRSYYEPDGKTISSWLKQPTFFLGYFQNHTVKSGLDYNLTKKTTIGVGFTGMHHERTGRSNASAQWLDAAGGLDSMITSDSRGGAQFKNLGGNLNARHVFSSTQELTADLDFLSYRIWNHQAFVNKLDGPGGYEQAFTGDLPSKLRILSAKADYTQRFGESLKLETGWKSSRVTTDSKADYLNRTDTGWAADLGKTNHFQYTENIHAAYGTVEKRWDKFTVQAGLRYEYTGYDATQLGNSARKDSSFSRKYNSLFPTAYLTYKVDSVNTFTFSAGRRIDRPAFQKLNPFVFVINKYTNQVGNPYILPQYTWNFELSHQFKELLVTSLSYSKTTDYFSQIFYSDPSGVFAYSDGNVGSRENFGLSVSLQAAPWSWWNLSLQSDLVHKKIKGFVNSYYDASITQVSMNINNQFRFSKGWAAELTAFYIGRSQEDLQEVLDPNGQVSAGIAKQLLKNKATLKLNVRDIFYTQRMQGNTAFRPSNEFFVIKRDTRVLSIALTWRFGKQLKGGTRRTGGADSEIERVNGG